MKLKQTFFSITIALVLLITFSLSTLLYSTFTKEMYTQAKLNTKETYQVLQEHINTKIETIVYNLERINSPILDKLDKLYTREKQELSSSELSYLQSKVQELSPILDEVEHLAKSLGEQRVQIALYDTNGTLLLHYASYNNTDITMNLYLPKLYPEKLIMIRERKMVTWSHSSTSLFQEDYIQEAKSLDDIKTTAFPSNLSRHKTMQRKNYSNRAFSISQENLAINYQTPLSTANDYSIYFQKQNQEQNIEKKYYGMIDLTLEFDAGEISKIASMTHSHINLFVHNTFSMGTLYMKPDSNHKGNEALCLKEFLTLDSFPELSTKQVKGIDYYESLFSIKTDTNDTLTLSILKSRELEHQAITSFLKKTTLIIVVFIVVVLIFTLIFNRELVIPIVNMYEVINKLAKGDLEMKEAHYTHSHFFEIKKIKQALDQLIKVELEISGLANKVADGDFTQSISPRSSKDTLIKSLNSMVKQLYAQSDQISKTNKALEKLSITDGLTELYNRRYFDESFKDYFNIAKRNAIPISIFMLDIDYFKKYNDHFGHQKGDECLQIVAQTMVGCVQRQDDFVARYGGEEFTIISLGISKQDAIQLGEKICKKIESLHLEHPLSEHKHVTVSMGLCSTTPVQEETSENLLKAADDALYQAKNNGRNRLELAQAKESY
jgi:diguanylate cyclase (GGDEF)-like protein